MALAVAIGIIFVLLFVLWIAFAKEPGPGPADVAVAYEGAWDRFDFALLYDLSGEELRDNLRREAFVAAKRAAYASAPSDPGHRTEVHVDEVVQADQTAVVVTRLVSTEGELRNNVMLEKRSGGWAVVGYSIRR